MLFKRPLSILSLYLEGSHLLSISSRSPFSMQVKGRRIVYKSLYWFCTFEFYFITMNIYHLLVLLLSNSLSTFTLIPAWDWTCFFISCALPYWRILSWRSRILSGTAHFQSPKVANTEKWSHESKASYLWLGSRTYFNMIWYIWYDMMMLPAQAYVPICWRALCSSYSHFIHLHFLSSSYTSLSHLLLLPHLLF